MIAALRNEGMVLKSQGPFNTENEVKRKSAFCCIGLTCKLLASVIDVWFLCLPVYDSRVPICLVLQKFVQHFGLLQKASLPKYDAYESFSESTCHARLDVSLIFTTFLFYSQISLEVEI